MIRPAGRRNAGPNPVAGNVVRSSTAPRQALPPGRPGPLPPRPAAPTAAIDIGSCTVSPTRTRYRYRRPTHTASTCTDPSGVCIAPSITTDPTLTQQAAAAVANKPRPHPRPTRVGSRHRGKPRYPHAARSFPPTRYRSCPSWLPKRRACSSPPRLFNSRAAGCTGLPHCSDSTGASAAPRSRASPAGPWRVRDVPLRRGRAVYRSGGANRKPG
jgi:hypothetical protein